MSYTWNWSQSCPSLRADSRTLNKKHRRSAVCGQEYDFFFHVSLIGSALTPASPSYTVLWIQVVCYLHLLVLFNERRHVETHCQTVLHVQFPHNLWVYTGSPILFFCQIIGKRSVLIGKLVAKDKNWSACVNTAQLPHCPVICLTFLSVINLIIILTCSCKMEKRNILIIWKAMWDHAGEEFESTVMCCALKPDKQASR